MSYALSPLAFFDARADGLQLNAMNSDEVGSEDEPRRVISKFVRTPDGMGVASLGADGSIESWEVIESGSGIVRRQAKGKLEPSYAADLLVVLDAGLWNPRGAYHAGTDTILAPYRQEPGDVLKILEHIGIAWQGLSDASRP